MKRILPLFLFAWISALCGCIGPAMQQSPPRLLARANVLPLALDPAFSFRKSSLFLHDPAINKPTIDEMIKFERERLSFGAISNDEIQARFGHYFRFWWRAERPAHLTVRLEYRQQNLGAFVQAREVDVPEAGPAHGTVETQFQIVGDDYRLDGRVVAWRALLIEKGKIVALTQSFLWN